LGGLMMVRAAFVSHGKKGGAQRRMRANEAVEGVVRSNGARPAS